MKKLTLYIISIAVFNILPIPEKRPLNERSLLIIFTDRVNSVNYLNKMLKIQKRIFNSDDAEQKQSDIKELASLLITTENFLTKKAQSILTDPDTREIIEKFIPSIRAFFGTSA